MKYELPKVGEPKTPQGKKQSEIRKIIIYPDEGESAEDLIFRIAVSSIIKAPMRRGMAFLDPHAFEPLLTSENLKILQDWANKNKELDIDHWKGYPVKTRIRIENDHISLEFRYWLDRWNAEDWGGWVLPWNIDSLEEVLKMAIQNTSEEFFRKTPIEHWDA